MTHPKLVEVSESQAKTARLTGTIFLVLGGIALIGSWAIKDPTVEKINMVVGAFVFFGIYFLMLLVGLHRQIYLLRKDLEALHTQQTKTIDETPSA